MSTNKKKGFLTKLWEKNWNWELSRIYSNKKIPVGGSCFVVGKKVAINS